MRRMARRTGIAAVVQGGCVIRGGLMEDGSGVHLHDRATPAINGAVTCF